MGNASRISQKCWNLNWALTDKQTRQKMEADIQLDAEITEERLEVRKQRWVLGPCTDVATHGHGCAGLRWKVSLGIKLADISSPAECGSYPLTGFLWEGNGMIQCKQTPPDGLYHCIDVHARLQGSILDHLLALYYTVWYFYVLGLLKYNDFLLFNLYFDLSKVWNLLKTGIFPALHEWWCLCWIGWEPGGEHHWKGDINFPLYKRPHGDPCLPLTVGINGFNVCRAGERSCCST